MTAAGVQLCRTRPPLEHKPCLAHGSPMKVTVYFVESDRKAQHSFLWIAFLDAAWMLLISLGVCAEAAVHENNIYVLFFINQPTASKHSHGKTTKNPRVCKHSCQSVPYTPKLGYCPVGTSKCQSKCIWLSSTGLHHLYGASVHNTSGDSLQPQCSSRSHCYKSATTTAPVATAAAATATTTALPTITTSTATAIASKGRQHHQQQSRQPQQQVHEQIPSVEGHA